MTPAIVFLEQNSIDHQIHQYQHDPNTDSYGDEALTLLKLDADRVFKTLVVRLANAEYAVAIVPVAKQADLKALAKIFKTKKVELANPEDAARITGYQVGGISPIAQKKPLRTVIDQQALHQTTIFVSGGRRGLEIELSATDLSMLCNAEFVKMTSN